MKKIKEPISAKYYSSYDESGREAKCTRVRISIYFKKCQKRKYPGKNNGNKKRGIQKCRGNILDFSFINM